MVDFVTFDDLKRFSSGIATNRKAVLTANASKESGKDTFLSHSSKDAEYLPAVIELLENHGASVYCDLGDSRLPDDPTPETAGIIKQQIRKSRRLVLFVTDNSKDSKWVPWELGIGDISLSQHNVALLPVSSDSYKQSWARQEYLGLYSHIVWGRIQGEPNPLWMVYDYRSNSATKLSQWFRS
ncbi:TIR domain-containing protein [Vibrio parahaemolyticus]|nr:TIR domain-containing protein [Vibrio parahaemolyticus]EGQ7976362.1 TIR domain-containing protein [Vibrio parahaemolyticus]